jgi:uncharacterized lipoprotein YmbA
MFSLIFVALLLTGCGTQASTAKPSEKFLKDAKALAAIIEDAHKADRQLTTDEQRKFDVFNGKYEKETEINAKTVVTDLGILYYDIKKLKGVDDTYDADLARLIRDLADAK